MPHCGRMEINMKSIVVFYTFAGSSRIEAKKIAAEYNGVLCEIKEKKNRGMLSAFSSGCFKAIKRKPSKIIIPEYDLKDFDRIVIGCPIWASFPAPAFNAIVDLLPENKEIELFFCSGSGSETKSEQGTKELIAKKNCKLISYRDIKTDKMSREKK